MTVRRRHVIYVPGYDPRGVAHYYRMFRHELGRFRSLHGLRTEVSRPTSPPDAAFSTWIVTTHGPGWQVDTTYELMRWDDVVRADAGRPIWRRIGAAWLLLARYLFTGALARIAWAHWRFGLFFPYPYITLLAIALAAALTGIAVAALFAGLLGASPPLALALLPTTIGAGLALAVMAAILRLSESRTYLLICSMTGPRPMPMPVAVGQTGRRGWRCSPSGWSPSPRQRPPTRSSSSATVPARSWPSTYSPRHWRATRLWEGMAQPYRW